MYTGPARHGGKWGTASGPPENMGPRNFVIIVKTQLQYTIGQERLSSLGKLLIENKLADSLDFDDVINDFASNKS